MGLSPDRESANGAVPRKDRLACPAETLNNAKRLLVTAAGASCLAVPVLLSLQGCAPAEAMVTYAQDENVAYPVEYHELEEENISAPPLVSQQDFQLFPETVLVESYFREDFDDSVLNEGWEIKTKEGDDLALNGGWLELSAEEGRHFPVVEGKEIFPLEGDFELTTRVDFPEKTGYGVFFHLLDEEGKTLFEMGGGRCANPFVRMALKNPETNELRSFLIFPGNGWNNSLGKPDQPHEFSFYFDEGEKGAEGLMAVDGQFVGRLPLASRPAELRMGNPETTAESGRWTTMKTDFVEVRQAAFPTFSIPEEPPVSERKLIEELDYRQLSEVDQLAVPQAENWALEIELDVGRFQLFQPAKFGLGPLTIMASKGFESHLVFSVGEEDDKFGFLVYPDVGGVEGEEILRRPKQPHRVRLEMIEGSVYLYVDDFLVRQGQDPFYDDSTSKALELSKDIPDGATELEIKNIRLYKLEVSQD